MRAAALVAIRPHMRWNCNGPDFYKLPRNSGTVTLRREQWRVPDELPFDQTTVVPLNAGETIGWRMGA
jgi:dihydroorotase